MQLHPSIDTTLLTNVTRAMLGMPEVNRKDTSIHPFKRRSYSNAFIWGETPKDENKGILGKRKRRLQARRQGRDMAVSEANRKSKGVNAEKANRIPGSYTK